MSPGQIPIAAARTDPIARRVTSHGIASLAMPPKIATRRSAGGATAAAADGPSARRYRTRSSARGLPPQTMTAEVEAEAETTKAEPE